MVTFHPEEKVPPLVRTVKQPLYNQELSTRYSDASPAPLASADLGHHQLSPALPGKILVAMFQKTRKIEKKKKHS
jgi:hypothetical protein